MRRERNDFKYLWDIQDAARHAVEFCSGKTIESLKSEDILQAALERVMSIVAGSASTLTGEFKAAHAEIEWAAVEEPRPIIRDYRDEDFETLWRLATVHCPALIAMIDPILEANPPQ